MAAMVRADVRWGDSQEGVTITEGLLVPLTWFAPGELPEESAKAALSEALDAEDYESAAQIRDYIKQSYGN